ncbi:MAG: hypothetical protein J7639_19200 [Paenibacillaceae bacterium]|nr:hypothetical protein [Paenibacillaceae bacterium]
MGVADAVGAAVEAGDELEALEEFEEFEELLHPAMASATTNSVLESMRSRFVLFCICVPPFLTKLVTSARHDPIVQMRFENVYVYFLPVLHNLMWPAALPAIAKIPPIGLLMRLKFRSFLFPLAIVFLWQCFRVVHFVA